jgi:hypothetical protein
MRLGLSRFARRMAGHSALLWRHVVDRSTVQPENCGRRVVCQHFRIYKNAGSIVN